MTTPFVMLALMTTPFFAALLAHRLGRPVDLAAAGTVGLGLLFAFTGIGHFARTEAMAQMLPPFVPGRVALVHATGLLEWAIALGFFVPRFRARAGVAAAFVLVAFFPANAYTAFARVPMGGHEWGPAYLLLRGPVQLAILFWVYRFAIRPGSGWPAIGRRTRPRPARS